MEISERNNLVAALQRGTVQVTFKKIDSDEIRVMPCTLNPVVLEAYEVKGSLAKMEPSSDHYAVWALDKEAWRSFRVETVVSWEVLGE
tara:strand:+ start:515 stop:778 length:264 start_codon:yes stop_codon:yes gene_type:complete